MTLPEIQSRYRAISDQRTRLEELRDYAHAVMLRCGVTRVADLPEGELEIIGTWGEGLPAYTVPRAACVRYVLAPG